MQSHPVMCDCVPIRSEKRLTTSRPRPGNAYVSADNSGVCDCDTLTAVCITVPVRRLLSTRPLTLQLGDDVT